MPVDQRCTNSYRDRRPTALSIFEFSYVQTERASIFATTSTIFSTIPQTYTKVSVRLARFAKVFAFGSGSCSSLIALIVA